MTEYWCYTRRFSRCRGVGRDRSFRCRCAQGLTFWPRSPFQGQHKRCAKRLTVLSCNMEPIEYRITRQQKSSAGFFRLLRVC
ncbi:hypothetical protein FMK65_13365 [Klebsiella variicola]|nr:hypothetical protein [Klebsiella variicola]PKJ65191.1 hypothetical protein CW266_09955 [Klebsiella sp. T11]PXG71625.1 hypothetical protein DMP35_12820 [Klebsiella variicola]PXL70473.1 hypothetical protein DMS68_16870 [Klebsiella variicola]